jgi:hypothetical protein
MSLKVSGLTYLKFDNHSFARMAATLLSLYFVTLQRSMQR